VAYCRNCNESWPTEKNRCPICGEELAHDKNNKENNEEPDWVMLGTLSDKPSADLAKEVLKSSGIPAVVISRSGFFGSIGLTLDNLYSGRPGTFELSVPVVHRTEAEEILDATLGDNWNRSES